MDSRQALEEHLHSAELDLLESLSYMMYHARQVREHISILIRTSELLRRPTPRIGLGLDAYGALDTHSYTLQMLGQEIAKYTSAYKADPELYEESLERWDYGEGITLFESMDFMTKSIHQARQNSWNVYNIERELRIYSRPAGGLLDWKQNELLHFANNLANVQYGKGFAGAVHRAKFLFWVPPFPRNLSAVSKELILWRDQNRCFLCSDIHDLHVHHINSNRQDNCADNLVTICHLCHKDLHERTYRGKPSKRLGCGESELRRRVQHCYYQG